MLILTGYLIYDATKGDIGSLDFVKRIISFLMIGITIVVMAVPEGSALFVGCPSR